MGLGTFVHLWILYGSILQNLPKRLCDVGTWWRLKWSNYSLIWDDLTMIWGYPPHSREPPFEWKNTHDECVFPYMWIKILQYIVWSEHNLYIQLYPGNYHNSLTWNQKKQLWGWFLYIYIPTKNKSRRFPKPTWGHWKKPKVAPWKPWQQTQAQREHSWSQAASNFSSFQRRHVVNNVEQNVE